MPPTASLIDATVDNDRIIDRDFLHLEASRAGKAERYGHGSSPHTLNVWWARRPLSAMQMIVYSALAGTEDAAITPSGAPIIGDPDPIDLEVLRNRLASSYGRPPHILDPFGGGGTSAMAAARLGCTVDTVDVNELAVFIQRTALEFPAAFKDPNALSEAVQCEGQRILSTLAEQTEDLFPLRRRGVTNYLWSHRQQCKDCGFQFMLTRRTGIRQQAGSPKINLVLRTDGPRQTAEPGDEDQEATATNWHNKRGAVGCPHCGSTQRARIRRSSDVCCALIQSKSGRIKQYHQANAFGKAPAPGDRILRPRIRTLLQALNCSLPEARLRRWSGVINPAVYGMRSYSDLFNRRQTGVFLELARVFQSAFDDHRKAHGEPQAKAVFALLSALFDQLIDWNCRLSMWIPQNEQVGRAFCGPGVSMIWDYCETDPCGTGPANLWSKLNRIVSGTRSLAEMCGEVTVHRCSARKLPMRDGTFDAVVTDPPYYDNIHYAALADFFYTWKRLPLQRIFPEDFTPLVSSADDEIVCSTFRDGKDAHENYVAMLADALAEAQRVLRGAGRIALVFGHASLRGWVALIDAYRRAGLRVSAAEPLAIERSERPRAVRSNAVNTCTVFISKKTNRGPRPKEAVDPEKQGVDAAAFAAKLIETGWPREDAAMAGFARSIIPLINDPDMGPIEDHLLAIQSTLRTSFPEFRLKHRRQ